MVVKSVHCICWSLFAQLTKSSTRIESRKGMAESSVVFWTLTNQMFNKQGKILSPAPKNHGNPKIIPKLRLNSPQCFACTRKRSEPFFFFLRPTWQPAQRLVCLLESASSSATSARMPQRKRRKGGNICEANFGLVNLLLVLTTLASAWIWLSEGPDILTGTTNGTLFKALSRLISLTGFSCANDGGIKPVCFPPICRVFELKLERDVNTETKTVSAATRAAAGLFDYAYFSRRASHKKKKQPKKRPS